MVWGVFYKMFIKFVWFCYQDFQNFFSGELLALADDAIVVKLTPGNDYYVNSGG